MNHLTPAARIILMRICDNKPVMMDIMTEAVSELFNLNLAYLEHPSMIKPTEKGIKWNEKRKRND